MKPDFKDVDIAIKEVELIRDRYEANMFLFGDEVSTLQPRYVEELRDRLQDVGIQWFCQTLANLADYYICTPYPDTNIYNNPEAYDVTVPFCRKTLTSGRSLRHAN